MSEDSRPSTPEELADIVAECRVFKAFDRSRVTQIAHQLSWIELEAGDVLYQQGDIADAMFVVRDGHLGLYGSDSDECTAHIGPRMTVGEKHLRKRLRRLLTCRAIEPAGVVRVPKEAFERLLSRTRPEPPKEERPGLPQELEPELRKVFPQVFGPLDFAAFNDLMKRGVPLSLPRGHILYYQSEATDNFYILLSGRLEKFVVDGRGETTISELAPHDTVGEMEVITGETRRATVTALRDSELILFSKDDFDELSVRFAGLWRHLTRELVGELEQVYLKTPRTALSTNILVAAASSDVDLGKFARRLQDALTSHVGHDTSCLLLTSEEVDHRLGIPDISQSSTTEDLRTLQKWLTDQERRYNVILLQTDSEVTEWTKRCISSADEVMFVAWAAADPLAGSVAREVQAEELAHQTNRRKALVLVHPPGTDRPRGTVEWLHAFKLLNSKADSRVPGRHFHIRQSDQDDYWRLARYVTHREVGLVLSGGGARGFAHVGCIRAMRELNIPIDMIAGVSMGSLVGAAYASDQIGFEAKINQIKSQLNRPQIHGLLNDFTFPLVSVARGRRFDRSLKEWFGEVHIEDLWLPYFCVTSNLTRADIRVHDVGPLWWAVRGSGTLPGITAPVVHNRELLLDGCLLNNLPMDVMRDRIYESQLVAVDVVPPHDLEVDVMNGVQSPSGWWLLWNRLNPFAEKVDLPNIFSILQRAGELGSVYGRQRLIDADIADLYIQPSVGHIHIANFRQVDESAQIGFDECRTELAGWWSKVNATTQAD